METPFLMEKLQTDELDFFVNQKKQTDSLCEALQDMFLAKISGSDRTFKVNKIAEFLDNNLNAEQQLY